MLLAGSNIISPSDKLVKITIDYLYHSLRNPKAEIVARIRQLRIIRELDNKQYSTLKRQLPYIVCGIFNPPFRRKENFAYIEYFIIDIDNLLEKGMNLQTLQESLRQDNRIVMSFTSPSENGLKVLFHLKNRCYDANIYSLFYKKFASVFSQQYHLEQVVDVRTSDVSRACFISIDSQVYYNPEAGCIDLASYIDLNNVNAMFELSHQQAKEEKKTPDTQQEPKEKDPEQETMDRIKAILNPKSKINKSEEKFVFVPEQLNRIIEQLTTFIESTGVEVYEITNIQYAKKLKFRNGLKLAEINLFYGKRGFSVVQSPRCGTYAPFNQLMADLINKFITDYSEL
jgi:hypothetical protein